MKKILLIAFCAIIFIGCNKNESIENFKQLLKEKYHGRYELISSVSEEAVDLNNDGISSNDLLSENSLISLSEITIVCVVNEVSLKDNEFYIDESWPVENNLRPKIKEVITTTLPPLINPYYDIYFNGFISRIDADFKTIRLLSEIQETPENTLLRMNSIIIEDDETLKVTTIRKLYTDKGWNTTKIESRYKRYTIST